MTISSKPAKKKPMLLYLLIGAAFLAGAVVIGAPLVARSIGGEPGMRTAAQDAAAVGTMKSIVSAQLDYQQGTDRHCYAASLAELDAGINGVGLISHQLATGQQHGYRFALAPGSDGCKSYVAVPLQYGVSGVRSFFADQSGVVRGADLGGEPAAADTPAVP